MTGYELLGWLEYELRLRDALGHRVEIAASNGYAHIFITAPDGTEDLINAEKVTSASVNDHAKLAQTTDKSDG